MRNIIVRKITASVLLAVMLMIQAVIFFHHHHGGSAHDKLKQAGVFSSSHIKIIQHCPLCEFKLNSDADLELHYIKFDAVETHNKIYTGYLEQQYTVSFPHLFLRGPPALS